MTQLSAPRSRAELLHRARNEARESKGERAFVRDARVLPFGVPLAVGLAALAYVARRPAHRHVPRFVRHHAHRSADLAAIGTAIGVLGATLGAAWLASSVEWSLRKRAWDHERGW